MKRSISSSDPHGSLISICPSTEEDHSKGVYSREFQSMLDGYEEEETCLYEDSGAGRVAEKKRRLSVDQVKALEKNFEVENKLEPERKVKLAQELGLQPRQVAVWFQNRRARWKTKTLERDYGYLKANYDSLKLSLESLQSDNQALIKEIKKLKSKLNEVDESPEKEEGIGSESENTATEPTITATTTATATPDQASMEFKDAGPSDSDTSAILSPKTEIVAPANSNSPPPSYNYLHGGGGFEFLNLATAATDQSSSVSVAAATAYQSEYVKTEEHNFFGEEAPCCNFFTEDQAPTLHWYTPESWA